MKSSLYFADDQIRHDFLMLKGIRMNNGEHLVDLSPILLRNFAGKNMGPGQLRQEARHDLFHFVGSFQSIKQFFFTDLHAMLQNVSCVV
jgi:hypothetical protein